MSEKKVNTEKVQKDLKNGAGLGQLALTLCAICAACALLLALTNMVTAPIIEANAEAKKAAAIAEKVLPGFTGTLTEMYYIGTDRTIKSVQQGGDGSFVVEVSPKSSYSGNLTLLIGISPDKTIAGISVSSTGETEGIGANALKDEYFAAQYVGKTGPVELTKNGGQVEGVTGATFTSTGVKDAVNSAFAALEDLSADATQVPTAPMISEDIISMAQEGDGYVAIVDCGPGSFSKTLKIQVNIGADKKVTSVTILETGETAGFGAKASEPEFIDQFVGVSGEVSLTRDGGEIETIAGASTTSNAICVGVTAALQAIDYPDQWPTAPVGPAEPTDPVVEDSPVTVAQEGDGYVVTVDCGPDSFSKTLKIEVQLDANKTVTGVTILESGETDGFGSKASEPEFIDQFVGVSGTVALTKDGGTIETIAGASTTANAICKGVNAALEAIGVEMTEVPTGPVETAAPVESQPAETPTPTATPAPTATTVPTATPAPAETPAPAADSWPVVDGNVTLNKEGNGYVAVVDCGPDSFSKTLKIQVNIGADKKVTGVTILDSGETPGFGAKASEPEFIDQFVGVSGKVSLTRDGGAIETIAGASTTSNAICVGVTAALKVVDAQG